MCIRDRIKSIGDIKYINAPGIRSLNFIGTPGLVMSWYISLGIFTIFNKNGSNLSKLIKICIFVT